MDYGLSNLLYWIILLSVIKCEAVEDCIPVINETDFRVPVNQTIVVRCQLGTCHYRFEGVTWKRHGRKINDYTESISEIRYPNMTKLRILRMNKSYEGEYVCSSEYSRISRSIFIHVSESSITTEHRTGPTSPSTGTVMTETTSFDEISSSDEKLTTFPTTSGGTTITSQCKTFWPHVTLLYTILTLYFINCEHFT
ncbi:uncharacterized protein LOC106869082 [Octopus bimaculoides]|uniref:Ig-like domain-containing protein n=1 Tax=Octopus bimaculoides TaxID=37653 RepID=A0A0L8HRH0_OCTBM|nr:uncharacterized protein LOC106869082 [Octopus bimaculoides]XP_052832567.1 uncharacterized protein LOC106869082 [Octopus bimaculoides]|eukprot:XP_014770091.1 PREDICTED: uncharacterized protein LOC106869082 [Octopus bimaculoides]